jgi:hypothetical protein
MVFLNVASYRTKFSEVHAASVFTLVYISSSIYTSHTQGQRRFEFGTPPGPTVWHHTGMNFSEKLSVLWHLTENPAGWTRLIHDIWNCIRSDRYGQTAWQSIFTDQNDFSKKIIDMSCLIQVKAYSNANLSEVQMIKVQEKSYANYIHIH